jgi:hypothetical protein
MLTINFKGVTVRVPEHVVEENPFLLTLLSQFSGLSVSLNLANWPLSGISLLLSGQTQPLRSMQVRQLFVKVCPRPREHESLKMCL